jgi:hypothetical protein
MSQVNTELVLDLKALISLGQANVRVLAGKQGAGTRMSMSDLKGKSSVSFSTIYAGTGTFTLQGTSVISNKNFFTGQQESITNSTVFTLGGSSLTSNNQFFIEYQE